jgi:hypothetical protein
VCVCVCVRASVSECVCACVRACVRACVVNLVCVGAGLRCRFYNVLQRVTTCCVRGGEGREEDSECCEDEIVAVCYCRLVIFRKRCTGAQALSL